MDSQDEHITEWLSGQSLRGGAAYDLKGDNGFPVWPAAVLLIVVLIILAVVILGPSVARERVRPRRSKPATVETSPAPSPPPPPATLSYEAHVPLEALWAKQNAAIWGYPTPMPPPSPDRVSDVPNVEPRDPARFPAFYAGERLGPILGGSVPDFPTWRAVNTPKDPIGPWERVGILVQEGQTPLPLFSRRRTRGERYDYRTVVNENLPIELAIKKEYWLSGETVQAPGLSGSWTVQLYEGY